MALSGTDWTIIAVYMALSLFVGVYLTKRASSSLSEYFLSGRNLPWWLAGTSMVATTFSSDTPLYVTGLVRGHGVYENWQWWCFIFSGMLSVFFFSRLWRRVGVLTDVELIEIRYSGRAASLLRGFKALYFSCIIHTIIKAQVILAMAKILDVTLGWGKWESIAVSSVITIAYSALSGYWGVVTTDLFQFVIAMAGAIVLAFASVDKAGGIMAIKATVSADKLGFFPPLNGESAGIAVMTFLGYIGLSWWSKYSSDGGGVIVQRISSCRSEKEGFAATLWFNVANYALRTWPWVLTALASLVIYPMAADHEAVYPMMVMDLLPSGLRGLVIASFFAAFMSTLSTYLNLSSAYFVNDCYRPFIKKGASDGHYIKVSRLATLALSVITAVVTYHVTSIIGVFKFLIAFGSGTGLVYIVRWFWWRVNAWSEISAMVASTLMTVVAYTALKSIPYYGKLALIISASTVVWLLVTYLTKPVDMQKLTGFLRRANPGGPGWRPVRKLLADDMTDKGKKDETMRGSLLLWAYGSLFLVGLTLGTGKMLLRFYLSGYAWLMLGLVAGWLMWKRMKQWKW